LARRNPSHFKQKKTKSHRCNLLPYGRKDGKHHTKDAECVDNPFHTSDYRIPSPEWQVSLWVLIVLSVAIAKHHPEEKARKDTPRIRRSILIFLLFVKALFLR
jgi:hypothetical protein